MSTQTDKLARFLRWFTAVWVFVELLALRLPLLDRFFFDTLHADTQGIDFYSLPKAWLNLEAHRSLYGTFDPPAFGPHFTWYLSHPVLALLLGPFLGYLQPGDSYGVFTFISLGVMSASAALLAGESSDPLRRSLIWLLLLCAFPTFDMLYVGNVQAFPVLGLTLLFVGLLRLAREQAGVFAFVFTGLLVSLLTKPVALILLPLLLLVRETRRAAMLSSVAYLAASLACELPLFNPEPIGARRIAWLALHPGFVRRTMNIYANHLALTPDMRDNSIHWFNLVAQSGFRLQHVDVFSLPVFLDGLLRTRTPDWMYTLPLLLVLVLSVAVALQRNSSVRRHAVLLLSLAGSLSFFVAYPTVWEYQYTAVLPVAASLLLYGPSPALPRRTWSVASVLGCCAALPSLYILSQSAAPDLATMTFIRLDRVLPVSVLFGLLLWQVFMSLQDGSSGSL